MASHAVPRPMTNALGIAHALADAAYDAWQEVQYRADRGDNVAMGADGTPTSRADRHVEAAMLEVARDAGVRILSEEAGAVGEGDLVAVIDPIDGTRNSSRGIPFFCTSIGIGTNSLWDLQVGVVRDLTSGVRYEAISGGGARVNGHKVTRRPFDPDDVLVALLADYSDLATVESLQRRQHHIRDLGSAALELCLVGTGALDAFDAPEDWLRVIDIAAGTLFVREAGGRVVHPATGIDLDTPFTLDARTGVLAVHDPSSLPMFLEET